MTTRTELIEQARVIEYPDKIPFMEEHGLTRAEIWPEVVAHEQKQLITETVRTARKKNTSATAMAKTRLLKAQDDKCSLCKRDIGLDKRSHLDQTGVVICCLCSMLVVALRSVTKMGVTHQAIIEFVSPQEVTAKTN